MQSVAHAYFCRKLLRGLLKLSLQTLFYLIYFSIFKEKQKCSLSRQIFSLKLMPDISWGDMCSYLVNLQTHDNLKAYKLLEAFRTFAYNHVQDIYDKEITKNSNFCSIKTNVQKYIFKRVLLKVYSSLLKMVVSFCSQSFCKQIFYEWTSSRDYNMKLECENIRNYIFMWRIKHQYLSILTAGCIIISFQK